MIDLKDLIAYWRANYQQNYATRTPSTNSHILDTIHYLLDLERIKKGALI